MGFENILYYSIAGTKAKGMDIWKAYISANRDDINTTYQTHKNRIEYIQQALGDKKSIDVFNAKIQSNFHDNFIDLERLYEDNQYYPPGIITLNDKEVFVDAGTFDGWTVIDFCNRVNNLYSYIYSFEPDPLRYDSLELSLTNKSIKNLEIERYGVYREEKEISFLYTGAGTSQINEAGNTVIKTVSLDGYFSDKNHKPTFIKMDIEGAELDALRGCVNMIAESRPKFAVCVYHKAEDIFDIPLFFMNNAPGYKIYLRQHGNVFETVCYAISD